MLVDIPDAGIILVSVLAFLSGLVTLYLYTKIRSSDGAEKIAPTNQERIDFYEKELIDMKIRLDIMELDGESFTRTNSLSTFFRNCVSVRPGRSVSTNKVIFK